MSPLSYRRKGEERKLLPIGIAPPPAIVSIIPPWIIRSRVRGVVIFSPEVNLFA